MHGRRSGRLLTALVLLLVVALLLSGPFSGSAWPPAFAGVLFGAFLIGLAGYRYRSAPWAGAALVMLAYLGAVGWLAREIGVIGCPHCEDHDGFSHLQWFTIWTTLWGFFAALVLAVIGAGALLASWLRRAGRDA